MVKGKVDLYLCDFNSFMDRCTCGCSMPRQLMLLSVDRTVIVDESGNCPKRANANEKFSFIWEGYPVVFSSNEQLSPRYVRAPYE